MTKSGGSRAPARGRGGPEERAPTTSRRMTLLLLLVLLVLLVLRLLCLATITITIVIYITIIGGPSPQHAAARKPGLRSQLSSLTNEIGTPDHN